ncbi:MAG: phosphoadenosine phosphosulfate reductase family protein [Bryobacteraceae bacterium]|nr:phosphoadenosine phosphosulfate reductase family protein [Bryobacteraceae bacterium]
MSSDSLVWPLQFPWQNTTTLAVTPDVERVLSEQAAVAIGVSGGKDSAAVAFAVNSYLKETGFRGPCILIHADLGRVEWRQSLPACERLAQQLDLELIVVRRAAGDLLSRWRQRWASCVRRYGALECVKLILPWSTASMRFCTSELKTTVICRELVKRFPDRTILSVTGIRREESARRAKTAIVVGQPLLTSRTHRTAGLDWHPILDWNRSDVFEYLACRNFELHEAYRLFGSSRVSCAFCILAAQGDLKAAARCVDNHDVYRQLVALEIESTFSFQDRQWLSDIAPGLLDLSTRSRAQEAKARAAQREAAERRIPKHLLYQQGWPTRIPTKEEASLLAEVRRDVAAAVGLSIQYQCADSICARYAELMRRKPTQGGHTDEPAMAQRAELLSDS